MVVSSMDYGNIGYGIYSWVVWGVVVYGMRCVVNNN